VAAADKVVRIPEQREVATVRHLVIKVVPCPVVTLSRAVNPQRIFASLHLAVGASSDGPVQPAYRLVGTVGHPVPRAWLSCSVDIAQRSTDRIEDNASRQLSSRCHG
jgi:hypothetical protein